MFYFKKYIIVRISNFMYLILDFTNKNCIFAIIENKNIYHERAEENNIR